MYPRLPSIQYPSFIRCRPGRNRAQGVGIAGTSLWDTYRTAWGNIYNSMGSTDALRFLRRPIDATEYHVNECSSRSRCFGGIGGAFQYTRASSGKLWSRLIPLTYLHYRGIPAIEFSCAGTGDRNKSSDRTFCFGWVMGAVTVSVRPVAGAPRCIHHTIPAVTDIVPSLYRISLLVIPGPLTALDRLLHRIKSTHPDATTRWVVFVLAR